MKSWKDIITCEWILETERITKSSHTRTGTHVLLRERNQMKQRELYRQRDI